MKQHKILILDGIPQSLIGTEFYHAVKKQISDTYYISKNNFSQKKFYGFRRSFSKLIDKKHSAYVHPKLAISQVRKTLKELKPTVVLVIGFSYHLINKPDLLDLKKQLGFELVLWDTDSANFGNKAKVFTDFITEEFTRYDRIFSFSQAIANYTNQLNIAPCDYLHFGAVSSETNRIVPTEKEFDICFPGNADFRRIVFLSNLNQPGLHLIGKSWKKINKILPEHLKKSCTYTNITGHDLYDVLTRSKISLNITGTYFTGINSGIPLRPMESIALKTFVLTENTPETSQLFEPGKEIEVFSNEEELQDKTKFYLNNNTLREKIALAGHERFIHNYTWEHQASKMLKKLKII